MNQTTTFSSVIPEESVDVEVANFREHFEGRSLLDQVVRQGISRCFSRPSKPTYKAFSKSRTDGGTSVAIAW